MSNTMWVIWKLFVVRKIARHSPLFVAALGLFLMSMAAVAESGQAAFKQGRLLEEQQKYEAAYDSYQKAYSANPKSTEYRAALTRLRFLAAAAKIHRGTLLLQAGDLQQALKLFEDASSIDASSAIALQQLAITRTMIEKASESHAVPPSSSTNSELNPDVLDAQGPVKLAAGSNVPITLKMTEDTKIVYQTVGKLDGINVLFDPDCSARRLSIELNGVTLTEALDLIAAESKTFWKAMTPNTIFVASDNPAKRKELEQNVVKTFYLSNLTAPTEMQDIVNTLRAVLDVSRVQQLTSQEAIVIRGTPDQVLLAEKMVTDFDQASPEVVIDFALMQVSRDTVHTLGISPATSATVQLQSNITSSSSSSSTSSTSSSSSSNSTNGINLNNLATLNATDFTATISSMNATALFTDSNTKIIQNPQIRSLNGQKATIKIGERVPTATGTSSSAINGVSLTGLNTTQFQYIDVGVNADITPHIHPDGDVTLKISLDVSSVTSYQSIGGISEPVIGQRKVEHEIRLKDGEVSLIGGMLEQDDTQSLTGYPGLSQIPILKYFFSQKNKEVSNTEIVFAVIPHIVRRRDVDEFSRKTIDVGTSSSVHLRHAPKAIVAAGHTSPSAPAAKAPGEANAALELDPTGISVSKGATFMINVDLSGGENVLAVPLQVAFDKQGLELLNISNGTFLSQGDQIVALAHREDSLVGTVDITASRPANSGGVSGHGVVTTLTFQAKRGGQFPVRITKAAVVQTDQRERPASGSQIMVLVQ